MNPPKRQGVDLRASAITEAKRLFAERGLGSVSVQDVADAVGTSKQALLYHYKTREALVDAVLVQVLDKANERLVAVMAAFSANEPAQTGRALTEFQTLIDEEPYAAAVLLRFLLDGGARAAERLHAGSKPWLESMVQIIRRGMAEGVMRPDLDPEAVVEQIGLLLLTNFATTPTQVWTGSTPEEWRIRRFAELVRSIRAMLFPG